MKTTTFHFKGKRNYLHATTLFDYIVDNYISKKYEPRNIDFFINRLTDKNCLILSKKINDQPPDKIIGQYKDNLSQLLIYETDDRIAQRLPYDETGIRRQCNIESDKSIICNNIANYSFMERVIAAYKFLLTSIYGKTYGKFLFARIMLSFIPKGKILITHERIISNKFFQGTINHENKEIGTIIFGVQKI